MDKQWTVIAVSLGDGTVDYGHRIWSEKFDHMAAAERASEFLRNTAADCHVTIIEPFKA